NFVGKSMKSNINRCAFRLSIIKTALMIAATASSAKDLYVSQSSPNPTPPYSTWDTAAHTIQEAVDAAADGDTVSVGPGEYLLAAQIRIDKAITLRSEAGASQTTLTGREG